MRKQAFKGILTERVVGFDRSSQVRCDGSWSRINHIRINCTWGAGGRACCYSTQVDLSGTVAAGGAANFWTENKDLPYALSVTFVSLAALAVSIVTSRQNLVATREIARQNLAATKEIADQAAAHNLQLAKMAAYQRIHELLVDPKAAAGRRRLFQAARANKFPALGEDGWDEINYSLALYDTLGGYMYRGQVDEDAVVLDAWHHPLVNIAGPVREFMAHRQAQKVQQPWAHLMDLLF